MKRTVPPAPETWEPARRVAESIVRPLERFLHVEASGGLVLLAAAAIALAWANSPWSDSYEHFWHNPVTFGAGRFISSESIHFWINDGLMTVFFFVVGLEIRRELHEGELSEPRRAALPVAAALGGMIAPALIYLALNATNPALRGGWGVPMATDIAFAVGVLALLGKRVPPALRVLLLALAIIDDIGAILVIALFYSAGISVSGLAIAGAGMLLIIVLQRFGVRRSLAYVLPGSIVWFGMLRAGIHPTIAGVVIGMLTPVRSWLGKEGFLSVAGEAMEEIRQRAEHDEGSAGALRSLRRVEEAHREALSPVVRLQAALHPWVAYGIMPLFALSNAGVSLRGVEPGSAGFATISLGVLLGLLVGKPLGIALACLATVKVGISALPKGASWLGILVVGCVAGIGFTMAIFIAGLAFTDEPLLATAKLAILVSSAFAAIVGLVVGRLVLPTARASGTVPTAEEAEASGDR